MPLSLSIVTPSYNRAGFIESAVTSVYRQWRDGMEHIIVDGGSSDDTMERLKQFDHLTVISEPDENLYDAVNKGLRRARGDVIGWLNSDDRYLENAFDAVLPRFAQDDTVDMVCGGASLVTLGAEEDDRRSDLFNASANKNLNYRDLLFDVPVINARFFRRTLIDRVGVFDIRFMPASDREFLIRCAMAGARHVEIDDIVHEYVLHEGSATIRGDTSHWEKMAKGHLEFAEAFLADRKIPAELRAALRSFHAKNALIGAAGALSQADAPRALKFVGAGWGQNPLWPFLAVYHAANWAGRKSRPAIGV